MGPCEVRQGGSVEEWGGKVKRKFFAPPPGRGSGRAGERGKGRERGGARISPRGAPVGFRVSDFGFRRETGRDRPGKGQIPNPESRNPGGSREGRGSRLGALLCASGCFALGRPPEPCAGGTSPGPRLRLRYWGPTSAVRGCGWCCGLATRCRAGRPPADAGGPPVRRRVEHGGGGAGAAGWQRARGSRRSESRKRAASRVGRNGARPSGLGTGGRGRTAGRAGGGRPMPGGRGEMPRLACEVARFRARPRKPAAACRRRGLAGRESAAWGAFPSSAGRCRAAKRSCAGRFPPG